MIAVVQDFAAVHGRTWRRCAHGVVGRLRDIPSRVHGGLRRVRRRPFLSHLHSGSCGYVESVCAYEGGLIQVDTRSFIERAIYMRGGYEMASVRLCRSVVRPGAVCIDAGANVGSYTLPLAFAAGPLGEVHAFEPHPGVRERLLVNIALNGIQIVTVNEEGLGGQAGNDILYGYGASTFNQGASSLRRSLDATEPLACRIRTVDDYAEEAGLGRVDFVKIDVEGADLDVLQGARSTLARHRPVLLVEANTASLAKFDATPIDLFGFLMEAGYRVWRNAVGEFDWTPRLIPLRSPDELPAWNRLGRGLGWENWLAVDGTGRYGQRSR
jgi:FkbM family methyltransferase